MATSNRKPYLEATTLDQDLLDQMGDNLDFGLELTVDIERPDSGFIRASDRNKYKGSTFYEALTNFPIISRTLGEWLSPTVEFSNLKIAISNVDGRFNDILPEGANFAGWIGKTVDVQLGLREEASTYESIYQGIVTDIGGFQRDRKSITFVTRDKFDKANQSFPNVVLTTDSFSDIETQFIGTVLPVIYGDWTTELNPLGASVPAYPVNGANGAVIAHTASLRLVVSQGDNSFFDTNGVYIKRGDQLWPVDVADVTVISGNNIFDIKQSGNGGTTTIDSTAWDYEPGDEFFVKVEGKDLGAYSDNIVWQARDILMTYGDVTAGEFDANWATYRDKAAPAESDIANIKSRVWIQEPQEAMQYVLSMLEQVRLEAFIDRNLNFKISSLQLDDFEAAPSFSIKNWDLEIDTFNPKLDDRNIWNRAQADYAFDPSVNENRLQTAIYKNQAAITQSGKQISKKVVFPNLYEEATVILQLKEMLKLASSYPEMIEMTLTPRAMKKDLGEFVSIDVDMGSTSFNGVPAMIREIGYDPNGLRIPVKLWSFQMTPFPGYSPGHPGIVGGSTATIIQET